MPVHLRLLRSQFLTFQLQTEREQKTVARVAFIVRHATLLAKMLNMSEQNVLQTFPVCRNGTINMSLWFKRWLILVLTCGTEPGRAETPL